MATYPSDATAPVTGFGVTTEITYTSTSTETSFNLAGTVSYRGEILAISDGVVQAPSTYAISNGGATVTFSTAPNASSLTLKTIAIPDRYKVSRQEFVTSSAEYSNTLATVINGNSYVINADQTSFALPVGSNAASAEEIMVFLSGVAQSSNAFTYPSTTLGTQGIDIADNSATKLLTNFYDALTDESYSAHTVTFVGGTAAYATYGDDKFITLDGTNDYLQIPGHDDFNVNDRSFTYDTWIRPDIGATLAANQTLFARHGSATNNYNLRLVGANSNVGFVINRSGSITELYGGNANGGSNYHVAVSYDSSSQNLRLYVNNVKVAHTQYVAETASSGNVTIGANSNITSVGEYFKGNVSFARMVHAPRYRSDTIVPITSSNAITLESGAPLGAIDPDDQLTIRLFGATITSDDRFTSMADRKPDKGFSSDRSFDTITFTSQAGYEKRRLKSRRSKRQYSLQYTNVTGIEKTAIENFYNARSGEFEAFSFDLSHINEVGTITTRFAGPLKVQQVLSTGSQLTENFYTVSFNLQETYD